MLSERVPEDRHDVKIVLPGGLIEVDVDLGGPELGGGEVQRDMRSAADLADPVSATSDFHMALGDSWLFPPA